MVGFVLVFVVRGVAGEAKFISVDVDMAAEAILDFGFVWDVGGDFTSAIF